MNKYLNGLRDKELILLYHKVKVFITSCSTEERNAIKFPVELNLVPKDYQSTERYSKFKVSGLNIRIKRIMIIRYCNIFN